MSRKMIFAYKKTIGFEVKGIPLESLLFRISSPQMSGKNARPLKGFCKIQRPFFLSLRLQISK
jgi:hypothetical protein